MSAGFIQLAAIGQQDVYLTGSPQVTYFLGLYRRHTPFVLEAYDIPFLGQSVKYDQNNICRIPRKGDLVRALTLKMTLPALKTLGSDWYWPNAPSASNAATLVINGNYTLANVAIFAGIDYYSTYNQANWLNGIGTAGIFAPYVTYNAQASKFVFSGASNVWVKKFQTWNGQTDTGVFWGLDPKNADVTTPVMPDGNVYLVYNISGTRTSDFNLEQAGWLRNPSTGMPDPPSRSGLFLSLSQSYSPGTSGYLNFGRISGTNYWTNWDATADITITTGGRIHFSKSGLYVMRVGLGVDTGSVSSVAWGASSTEDGEPPIVTFTQTYPWRVSPNPSTPAVFPMNITSTLANVYVYAFGTGSNFVSNSYVAVNRADDFYLLSAVGQGITIPSSNYRIPFYSNIVNTFSGFTSLATDGSATFKLTVAGPQTITGTLYLSSNYVSNVSLWESANLVYTYDMSSQGRDPTFAFTIPVNVTDVARNYSLNVAVSNTYSSVLTVPDVVPTGTGSTGAWTVNATWGQYSMNASTEYTNSEAWRGFGTGYWQASTVGLYSTSSPFAYLGTTYLTIDTAPVIYYGEWIQLVAPTAIRVTQVTITAASADTAPGECVIFGNTVEANNGWTVLKTATALSGGTDVIPVTTGSSFRWIRIAFTKAYNGTAGQRKPRVQVAIQGVGPNILLNNSHFIFSQVGVPSTTVPSIVLPYNGLMFTPTTTTLASPLRLTTDFTTYGNASYISNVTSSNTLRFSNVGTYMVTGAICTADQLTSMTVTSSSGASWPYVVSMAMRPPYTISLPFRVSNVQDTFSISVTTSSVTAAPNLFSNTFLTVVPLASTVNSPPVYKYYDSVGTWAIKSAELKIGGQLVESLSGEFIELWNDLYVPYENQSALKLLTGKGDTTQVFSARTYFVNLPFYFYGHPELSIPLVSLDRQDLEVHVTFRPFSNLTPITTVTNPTLDATIITEYVYLSEPEIQWFRGNKIEQVITQCQYATFNLPASFTSGVFALDFKNPVRELFFVIQTAGSDPYDYSGNGFDSMSLAFNGQEMFISDTTDHIYVGSLEPFKHYPNFPSRDFYMYSFCQKPQSTKPSGYVNFSRIRQVLLALNVESSTLARQFRVLAVNHNVLRFENGLVGIMFNS